MAEKTKQKRASGAIRVGVITDFTKPENPKGPRVFVINGEKCKVWPEETVGWKKKTPVKASNAETLKAIGQLALLDADQPSVMIEGYEILDDYGITFYATKVTNPAPDGVISRFVLSQNDTSNGNGSGGGSSPLLEGMTALRVAAVLRAEGIELDEELIAQARLVMAAGKDLAGSSANSTSDASNDESQSDESNDDTGGF